MKYQDFIEGIKNQISNRLTDGQKVFIHPVTKNNGIIYDGLFIMDPILNVSPTIYLNPYYHRYLNGASLDDIYEDILNTYRANLPKQDFDVSVFTDYSKAKQRIVTKLINRKRNEALLREVPFIPYLDLAIVFVCTVSDFLEEYATILIHNQHLQLWGITKEELYRTAMSNTPRLLPYQLEDMKTLLNSLTPQHFPWFDGLEMYILTNHLKIHGASCMIYPGLLAALSTQLDSDLILIPSSIHEILILPEKNTRDDYSPEDFAEMIAEVNETQLTDDEILGDHAYLYKRDSDSIEF